MPSTTVRCPSVLFVTEPFRQDHSEVKRELEGNMRCLDHLMAAVYIHENQVKFIFISLSHNSRLKVHHSGLVVKMLNKTDTSQTNTQAKGLIK